jgi:hypothetical protein
MVAISATHGRVAGGAYEDLEVDQPPVPTGGTTVRRVMCVGVVCGLLTVLVLACLPHGVLFSSDALPPTPAPFKYTGVPEQLSFAAFKATFGKTYKDSAEERHRGAIFASHIATIQEHNNAKGQHTFRLGVNAFSDLTVGEYRERFLMTNVAPIPSPSSATSLGAASQDLPATVDWRTKGAVSHAILACHLNMAS